jgi:O-antigen/teichoic acid export membrane protein
MSAAIDSLETSRNLASRFRTGVFWNLVAAILAQGTNFLSTIIIARLLGRELFGQYGLIQNTLLTLAGMAQIATGITATKYVAELRERDRLRAGRILALCSAVTFATGIVACGIILSTSHLIAVHMLHSPTLAVELRMTAVVALFTVINGYQTGALAGLERYKVLAFGNGLKGALQLTLIFLLTQAYGLTGALLALVGTSIARWAIFEILIRRAAAREGIYIQYRNLQQEISVLHGFAFPAALAGLMSPAAIWGADVLIVRQTGNYSQLALFNAAFNLKSVIMFLPLLLNNVGMSLLNNQFGTGNARGYRRIFWSNIALTGTAAALGALAIAAFGRQLLHFYGKDFDGARTVLLVLAGSSVLEAIGIGAYQVVQAREKMWLSLVAIAFPRDALLVILTWKLGASHGAFGLACAWSLGWAACTLSTLVIAYRLGLNVRSGQQNFVAAVPEPARTNTY